MLNNCRRSGLTIVELLVCVFIIGLLCALLLPAVQSARESSRRAQCESRLGQMARALHAYESARAAFPSALAPLPAPNTLSSNLFYAPHVYLLPYLEQAPLYGRFDVTKQQFFVTDPGTLGEAANTKIPTFVCPSDSGASGTNYRVCLGPGPYCLWQSSLAPGGGLGAFSALYAFRSGDFTDGLANTIAISEKLKARDDLGGYTPQMFWYSGIASIVGLPLPGTDQAVTVCGSLSGPPPNYFPFVGRTWFIAGYEYTWYNHTVAPNSTTPDCSMESKSPSSTNGGVFKASSRHPGGVNCTFMDGHTQFISNEIDLLVWRSLATRSGGEAFSGDVL
jgi:prepilin-type processing-associated H-X9-DG protein